MNKIWNITPFDSMKRLGHIHNEFCALIPDNDFVLITDPDVLFLHPHQLSWIEDILEYDNGAHDLLGCMANRIGVKQQVAKAVSVTWETIEGRVVEKDFKEHEDATMFDLKDMHLHSMYASLIHDKRRYEIEDTHLIAGFFMLFRRSLWNKIKFEESIQFDMKFCDAVKKSGGKIGIMKGIYLYHSYRLGSDNPTKDKKHLI